MVDRSAHPGSARTASRRAGLFSRGGRTRAELDIEAGTAGADTGLVTARPNRIAVIGDVHACDERLELLLLHLETECVDRVACVGDIVDGPGDPDAAAALLRAYDVAVVRGNHDRWILEGVLRDLPDAHALAELAPETVAYLTVLPPSLELPIADGPTLLLCHGLGDNDMNKITADDYGYALEVNDELQALLRRGRSRVVVKGHRHRPAVWEIGPLTLVDAGSLLDDCETCAVIVDGAAGTITPLGIGSHQDAHRRPWLPWSIGPHTPARRVPPRVEPGSGVYPGAPKCRFRTG
jgi:predicted phosphodiesterase